MKLHRPGRGFQLRGVATPTGVAMTVIHQGPQAAALAKAVRPPPSARDSGWKPLAGVGLNGARASTCSRTGARKRHWGSFHSLALGRCTSPFLRIRRRDSDLVARLLGSPWHTSGSGRGGSDPPARGLGAVPAHGVFSHPCPRPLGVAPEPAVRAGRRPLARRDGHVLKPRKDVCCGQRHRGTASPWRGRWDQPPWVAPQVIILKRQDSATLRARTR